MDPLVVLAMHSPKVSRARAALTRIEGQLPAQLTSEQQKKWEAARQRYDAAFEAEYQKLEEEQKCRNTNSDAP